MAVQNFFLSSTYTFLSKMILQKLNLIGKNARYCKGL
jgi:hypothetical protein